MVITIFFIYFFSEYLTDKIHLALFAAGTTVRDSPLQICNMPRAEIQPAKNLSSGFVKKLRSSDNH